MTDMLDFFLDRVEAYFGKYATAEIRGDVRHLLSWRIAPTKAHLDAVLEAMKLSQPIRFGPPDVATTLAAIMAWEKEQDCTLRPAKAFSTAEPVTDEESAKPTAEDMAEVRGIFEAQASHNPVASIVLRMIDGDGRGALKPLGGA